MNRVPNSLRMTVVLIALTIWQLPASAAPPTPDTESSRDVRTFVVTAALPPVPALTYRFDFPRDEQYDGNGVATFLQALMMSSDEKAVKELIALDDLPSDADFVAAVRRQAPFFDTRVPTVLASAIRFHSCTFDLPIRDEGINTLLPYLNHTRALAKKVQIRARLATATGDWPQTIELIRALAVMADHTDDGDTVIVTSLVGVGIAELCVGEIQRLMERSESPNLYWALRQLDVPFGDVRRAARNESSLWEMTFPELREARRGRELSAAEWQRVASGLAKLMPDVQPPMPAADPTTLAAAREAYARRFHREPAEVEQLDVAQVVAAYFYFAYREAADDVLKWGDLPYAQALPGVAAATARFDELNQTQVGNLILRIGKTGLSRALISNARLDRAIAATATVEAVRAYAADHNGRLPATLTDIADTPPPDNPATGRPFDYAVQDGTAIISDPGQWTGRPLRYEVRLRK